MCEICILYLAKEHTSASVEAHMPEAGPGDSNVIVFVGLPRLKKGYCISMS